MKENKPKRIVLHHSATIDGSTFSWDDIKRYHTSWRYKSNIISEEQAKLLMQQEKKVTWPWSDIGYHDGIELIGDQYFYLRGRLPNVKGAHCAVKDFNKDSLGICFVGNYDIQDVSREMFDMGIRLVKYYMQVYEIPASKIYGHREIDPRKSCPGKKFPLDEFRNKL